MSTEKDSAAALKANPLSHFGTFTAMVEWLYNTLTEVELREFNELWAAKVGIVGETDIDDLVAELESRGLSVCENCPK